MGVYQALNDESQIGLVEIEVAENYTFREGAMETGVCETGLKNLNSENEGFRKMLNDIEENGVVYRQIKQSIFSDNEYGGFQLGNNELFFKQNMNDRDPIYGVMRTAVFIYNSSSKRTTLDIYI